jgi:hypothetical protein
LSKQAFTLLELIFVIILSSIIGVVILRVPDYSLELARDQLIKDIRYTQTLALLDTKFKESNNSSEPVELNSTKFWFKSFWQLKIGMTYKKPYYTIFSDKATDSRTTNFDKKGLFADEVAIDPATGKYKIGRWSELYSSWKLVFKKYNSDTRQHLGIEYGIDGFEINNTLKGRWRSNKYIRIIFDGLGRPYYSYVSKDSGDLYPFKYLLQETVQIKLVKDEDKICFNLESISGLAYKAECIF